MEKSTTLPLGRRRQSPPRCDSVSPIFSPRSNPSQPSSPLPEIEPRERSFTGIPTQNKKRGDRLLRYLGIKKKTHIIHNTDECVALCMLSPTPHSNISSFAVKDVGVSFTRDGKLRVQKVMLMQGVDRKMYLHTINFYMTVLFKIGEIWYQLWMSRKFSCSKDVQLLQRHVEEAKYGGITYTMEEVKKIE